MSSALSQFAPQMDGLTIEKAVRISRAAGINKIIRKRAKRAPQSKSSVNFGSAARATGFFILFLD